MTSAERWTRRLLFGGDHIKFKRLLAAVALAAFCLNTTAYASSGDPNIDHGGSGLESGASGNLWYSGDEGVRVTQLALGRHVRAWALG